jgi:hypothetical protein
MCVWCVFCCGLNGVLCVRCCLACCVGVHVGCWVLYYLVCAWDHVVLTLRVALCGSLMCCCIAREHLSAVSCCALYVVICVLYCVCCLLIVVYAVFVFCVVCLVGRCACLRMLCMCTCVLCAVCCVLCCMLCVYDLCRVYINDA